MQGNVQMPLLVLWLGTSLMIFSFLEMAIIVSSEMTYIVLSGALNSTHYHYYHCELVSYSKSCVCHVLARCCRPRLFCVFYLRASTVLLVNLRA